MKIQIHAFGIAKDILGGNSVSIELASAATVSDMLKQLRQQYPDFEALRSLAVAVNAAYAEDTHIIAEGDEVVLIPPVAGG